jgi:hypothetical protein
MIGSGNMKPLDMVEPLGKGYLLGEVHGEILTLTLVAGPIEDAPN